MARVTIVGDEAALAAGAAERVTRHVEAAAAERGSAVVAMTGGRAAERLYGLLGAKAHAWRARIDWSRVHLLWGDERHVPPEHADSNFGMANRALVEHVPIPASQVHRMRGELPDPDTAAREYEQVLRRAFTAAGRADRTFDLVLLGLGEDAHIASIFPASPLFEPAFEPGARVAAVWAPHLNAWRLTLTPAALLDTRAIVVMVFGEGKAAAIHAALEQPEDIERYPAQLLRFAGDRVEWIVDRAASARLRAG